jgi:hypothetical protein
MTVYGYAWREILSLTGAVLWVFLLPTHGASCQDETKDVKATVVSQLRTNSPWLRVLGEFTMTNSSVEEIAYQLEKLSAGGASNSVGVRILTDGLNCRIGSERFSIHRKDVNIISVFLEIVQKCEADFRIVENWGVIGSSGWRAVPLSIYLDCIDAQTGKSVQDVKVVCNSKHIWPLSGHAAVIDGRIFRVWRGQALIRLMFAGGSSTLVDAAEWERKIRLNINADGYKEREIEVDLFGDLNNSHCEQVRMMRLSETKNEPALNPQDNKN